MNQQQITIDTSSKILRHTYPKCGYIREFGENRINKCNNENIKI